MLCVQCVVGCGSYHSIVPALKSIVNWACCDFLMEISVAWCQRGLSLQLQLRITVINNHQVPLLSEKPKFLFQSCE